MRRLFQIAFPELQTTNYYIMDEQKIVHDKFDGYTLDQISILIIRPDHSDVDDNLTATNYMFSISLLHRRVNL